ncbi:MAG: hypothetical protein QOI71_656, partial [Gaiellales bacterium]|nr:hypothetical protein [Gaiellales bacterium]
VAEHADTADDEALGLLRRREVGQDDHAVTLHRPAVMQDIARFHERRELLDDLPGR